MFDFESSVVWRTFSFILARDSPRFSQIVCCRPREARQLNRASWRRHGRVPAGSHTQLRPSESGHRVLGTWLENKWNRGFSLEQCKTLRTCRFTALRMTLSERGGRGGYISFEYAMFVLNWVCSLRCCARDRRQWVVFFFVCHSQSVLPHVFFTSAVLLVGAELFPSFLNVTVAVAASATAVLLGRPRPHGAGGH